MRSCSGVRALSLLAGLLLESAESEVAVGLLILRCAAPRREGEDLARLRCTLTSDCAFDGEVLNMGVVCADGGVGALPEAEAEAEAAAEAAAETAEGSKEAEGERDLVEFPGLSGLKLLRLCGLLLLSSSGCCSCNRDMDQSELPGREEGDGSGIGIGEACRLLCDLV